MKFDSVVATGHMQSISSQRNHITPCGYFWPSYLTLSELAQGVTGR